MNWFKNLFAKPPSPKPKLKVELPVVPRLALEDWQRDLEGITAFKKFHDAPEFQRMLALLQTVRPKGGKDGNADRQLGYIAGYEACLSTIYVLTRHPEQNAPEMEPDYGSETVLKTWK